MDSAIPQEQSKLRIFFLSPAVLIAAQVALSVAIAAGAIFYTYATVIVYRLWKLVLIDIDFILCCGALFTLVYFEKHPDCKAWHLIIPFVIGAGVFAGLFFGAQAILANFFNRTVCCLIGVSVALAFDLACVIAQDIFAIKRDRKFYLLATVAFVVAVYVVTLVLSALTLPHGWLFKSLSKDDNTFETAAYEAYAVTAKDRQAGKEWMNAALMGDGKDAPFDFAIGDMTFRAESASWAAAVEKSETAENGDISFVKTYSSPSGLEVRLVAAYYELTATVEWTVYLTNHGAANTPVVTDLYAMDASLDIPSPTLYFSGGSNEANDDFTLYSRSLGSSGYTFDTVNGRASKLYLPFFNLSSEKRGATLGVGWSGEWTAHFAAEDKTSVRIGQSALSGYIAPGESIRTPLIALSLYSGGNPLKGFNNFRNEIKRGLAEDRSANMLLFAGAEGQDDTSRANSAGTKAYVEKLAAMGLLEDLDYAWYDAAWYDTSGTGDWRQSVGDWRVDAAKYPEGLGAISDYLKTKGVDMLLWYEPERVPMQSELYASVKAAGHTSWLIEPENGSADCLWNMGDKDALQYVTDYIAASLIENGVSYYRQDFNIDPKRYWERADRELEKGRTGFAENKYVVGEYAFLDALRERIPGLYIDNCASGGRRIDMEMCRRAVPLWRSDYQCKTEKTDLSESVQQQTYGLSLWLPYSSITNPNAASEYDFRSLLGACVMCYADVLYDSPDAYAAFVRDYERVKGYFSENYYPLTPGVSREGVVAMQFGSEKAGVILRYSREEGGEVTLLLNGLNADKHYTLRPIEGGTVIRSAGNSLMKKGFTAEAEGRSAHIILYSED